MNQPSRPASPSAAPIDAGHHQTPCLRQVPRAVPGEDAGEARLAEAGGAAGRRKAAEEGKRDGDRRCDIGEARGGAGPQAVAQAAQPAGERGPLGDEAVACTHQRAQRLNAPVEAGHPVVPIHPDVVKACRPRARAAGGKSDPGDLDMPADILRTDRHLGRAIEPGLDEIGDRRVGDRPAAPLDRHRQLGDRRDRRQAREHLLAAFGGVLDREALDRAAGVVDHADGMPGSAPILSWPASPTPVSPNCGELTRAGRSSGSLIDRRSGRRPLARHPVVDLPAPVARRVSRGPSNVTRRRPSRPAFGWASAMPLRRVALAHCTVQQ